MKISAGSTLLLPGGHKEVLHLFLVLTDPDPKTRKVVVVMVVTERPHTDKTVTLAAGSHPFIRHDSNVDYGTCRIVEFDSITGIIENGPGKSHISMSAEVLQRVRDGLLKSSRTVNFIKDYCRARFDCTVQNLDP